MNQRRAWPCARLAILLLPLVFAACAHYAPPKAPDPSSWRAHAGTEGDDRLQMTVAVLTDQEARETFGVDLHRRWIQAVWIEARNQDTVPYWLLFPSLDPDYFSPHEVAYSFRRQIGHRGYLRLAAFLKAHAFRNPVAPGVTRRGFAFVNLDEGLKEIDIQLLSSRRMEHFTFFLRVPGLHTRGFAEVQEQQAGHPLQDIDEDELRFALTYLPCCTTDAKGQGEGDPLNLIFIGNPEDLVPAFIRRGWRPAEDTYWDSVWKTIGSFLFGHRYRYSPVSPLYVFGRKQDIAMQKARDTVNRRNHLRLWLTPLRYEGKSVWIGQISRDIGVRFTLHSGFGVTHKIDPDVDETRNALLQDMLYSQGLKAFGFVRGVGASTPDDPRSNLTGDRYYTDGLRAVLLMDHTPTAMQDVRFFPWERPRDMQMPQPAERTLQATADGGDGTQPADADPGERRPPK